MSSWINTDVTCNLHMANFRIPVLLIERLARLRKEWGGDETPRLVEDMIRGLLELAEGGMYRDAQLWRLFAPYAERHWVATIIHPLLPAYADHEDIPLLDLRFPGWSNKLLLPHLNTHSAERMSPDDIRTLSEEVFVRMNLREVQRGSCP
jgi:hypothetical protein